MWEDASLTCDQSDGAGGNTLFATGESEMFGCGGFDGDVLFGNLHDSGERALHFGNIGTDFRTLCNDGGIDVADFITGFAHELHGSRQQNLTVDVLELLTVIGKIKTDVAQSGSSEHGVADGMDQYVGITVAQQSQRMFNPDASQPKRTIGHKTMDVISETGTYLHDNELFEEAFDAIHIEGKRETQGLIQRVALNGTDQIGGIELEDAHLETGTK